MPVTATCLVGLEHSLSHGEELELLNGILEAEGILWLVVTRGVSAVRVGLMKSSSKFEWLEATLL